MKLALLANGEINSGLIRSYLAKYHNTLITEKEGQVQEVATFTASPLDSITLHRPACTQLYSTLLVTFPLAKYYSFEAVQNSHDSTCLCCFLTQLEPRAGYGKIFLGTTSQVPDLQDGKAKNRRGMSNGAVQNSEFLEYASIRFVS